MSAVVISRKGIFCDFGAELLAFDILHYVNIDK